MDGTRFDALAKLLAGPASRRSAIRSLSGGTFGAVLGLLGLAEAEAGDKKKKKKNGGGGGGKKKKKKRGCPENAVDCGGSCAGPGECCPGEKKCGGGCIAGTSCCPYTERQCPGGGCVAQDQCCPGEKKCGGGCISDDSCCPYTERECPNGSCVSNVDGCCDETECGDCGTCANGRCLEVPGLCDPEKCERCNFSTGSCESRCTDLFGICCNGDCKPTGTGPWTPCGSTCCSSQFNQTCCGNTTCCSTHPCYECVSSTGTCRYKCEGYDFCDNNGVCKNCDPVTGCGS